MSDWISVKKKLPNKNTRYARKDFVEVLGFDEDEYKDCGNFTPYIYYFNFKTKRFQDLAHYNGNTIKVDVIVSHWMELPNIPKV